jgi:hypothetical protein
MNPQITSVDFVRNAIRYRLSHPDLAEENGTSGWERKVRKRPFESTQILKSTSLPIRKGLIRGLYRISLALGMQKVVVYPGNESEFLLENRLQLHSESCDCLLPYIQLVHIISYGTGTR